MADMVRRDGQGIAWWTRHTVVDKAYRDGHSVVDREYRGGQGRAWWTGIA